MQTKDKIPMKTSENEIITVDLGLDSNFELKEKTL
jgi:hypothetical protein